MSVTIEIQTSEPQEMDINLSSANFYILWTTLGIVPKDAGPNEVWYGEITSRELSEALAVFDPNIITVPTTQEGNLYDGGITLEQAQRYKTRLEILAEIAERANKPIVWH